LFCTRIFGLAEVFLCVPDLPTGVIGAGTAIHLFTIAAVIYFTETGMWILNGEKT
jgi:hypothetical protein